MNLIEKKLYMNTAYEYRVLSKCAAKQVCCVLVKDNNIISIGVNGSQPGVENCNNKFKKINNKWFKLVQPEVEGHLPEWIECPDDEHHNWSLINETHAEINALAKANKNGTSTYGASAFVTFSPCFNCAKTLVTFGIKEIYYMMKYDDFEEVEVYLKENGVKIDMVII